MLHALIAFALLVGAGKLSVMQPAPTPCLVLHQAAVLPQAGGNTWSLNVPGRIQYGQDNGYCGEVSLQMLMLRHGVWIPQQVARNAGGGELLPGVNYDSAMSKLRVAYEAFTGSGYQDFVVFAKRALKAGKGVVTVVFLKGYRDQDYDHIEPLVGVTSNTTEYSPDDVLYVNNDFSVATLARPVAGFSCTAAQKTSTLAKGGCIPAATRWGFAIQGPTYAGIGPPVLIQGLNSASEPRIGRSNTFSGTVVVRNLTVGVSYKLHRVTDLASVPASAANGVAPSTPVVATWVASKQEHSFPASFQSASVAYYIAVPA